MGKVKQPSLTDLSRLRAPEPITTQHRLENFKSGAPELDTWLIKRALKNEHEGASRSFVLCSANAQIIGYYCLANGSVYRQQTPSKVRRNMPEPIPVMVLGRLAIDLHWQGLGLGKALLKDAILRTLNAAGYAGIRAILVHVISDDAYRFYEQHGFLNSPADHYTLMLFIKGCIGQLSTHWSKLMSQILLIANLNNDRIIQLDSTLIDGHRIEAHSVERRLGGAAANAGSALAYAGHNVQVACALGDDDTGNWLIAQAQQHGLDVSQVARYRGTTPEVLIMRASSGERTIVFIDRRSPYRPPNTILHSQPDCVFVNSHCTEVAQLMSASLEIPHCLVVAQIPRQPITWPAHILIGSETDLDVHACADPYAAGKTIAGETLRWVVITRGAAGAEAYSAHEQLAVPAYPAPIIDTTGAGDIFNAGLIDTLLAGKDMQQALTMGVRWAAFAVASPSSVAPESLGRFLRSRKV